MSLVAILWVLFSALTHVFWNTLIKRSKAPEVFSWLLQLLGVPLGLAAAIIMGRPLSVPPVGWVCAAATGLFYCGYYTLIAGSYKRGDLSLVYPIARGVAPVFTALWGVFVFAERPTLVGMLGIALICAAVFLAAIPEWSMARRTSGRSLGLAAILFAVATGLCTSGYSAVDKEGVRHVDPVLYLVLCLAAGCVLQGALLWRQGRLARPWDEARRSGWWLIAAVVADLLGYIIVLFVLRDNPVSYVVPLRSVAVLFSIVAGIWALKERWSWPRLGAALLILAGIAAIAAA